ncbi:MAG: hypothetical protein LUG99_17245 [Lachnospiraceae bacterium]|nr:hypothetical protein [Lachnospiraceae bacterium]
MLKTAGNVLYYYTFPKETSRQIYEVDFLISRKNLPAGGEVVRL